MKHMEGISGMYLIPTVIYGNLYIRSRKLKSNEMNRTLSEIFKTGLVVGSFDILLAFVDAWLSFGILPIHVLKFIASGLLGNEAFQHSYGTALLGLVIHFLIALFWTMLFFTIYLPYRKIVRTPFLQGIFFGLFVWSTMNVLILPHTNVPKSSFQWFSAIKGLVILIIAVGLPLAYFAKRYFLSTPNSNQ